MLLQQPGLRAVGISTRDDALVYVSWQVLDGVMEFAAASIVWWTFVYDV